MCCCGRVRSQGKDAQGPLLLLTCPGEQSWAQPTMVSTLLQQGEELVAFDIPIPIGRTHGDCTGAFTFSLAPVFLSRLLSCAWICRRCRRHSPTPDRSCKRILSILAGCVSRLAALIASWQGLKAGLAQRWSLLPTGDGLACAGRGGEVAAFRGLRMRIYIDLHRTANWFGLLTEQKTSEVGAVWIGCSQLLNV
jgi:hypothetical protein